jgi:hypothetical protein
MKSTGLLHEFQIKIGENPRPLEIEHDKWTNDQPMRCQTASFLVTFGTMPFEALVQERDRINDVLAMLDALLQTSDEDGAAQLASKQRSMWITELLENI